MRLGISDGRRGDRLEALHQLAIDVGQHEFDDRNPDVELSPVVALICAYEEERNIAAVVSAVPRRVCGMAVTPVVVVDGGNDRTAELAEKSNAVTFVLPVNLGHGVALRVGYDLCLHGDVRFVVTLDADGQNDPSEIPVLVDPLVKGEADFVVASRRLGDDRTSDRYRKAGVRFFAWLMNRLNGTELTDTSNGFRALRIEVLRDVAWRLVQDQYQTAELLTTAIRRGWRVAERPTVWHERASGESKKGANWRYGVRYARVLVGTWVRERAHENDAGGRVNGKGVRVRGRTRSAPRRARTSSLS